MKRMFYVLLLIVSCYMPEQTKKSKIEKKEENLTAIEKKYIDLKKAVIKNDPSVSNISDQFELAKFLLNHVFQNITLGKKQNESDLIRQHELSTAKFLVDHYNYYYHNPNDGLACWGYAYMFSMICEAFEIPSRFVTLCDNIIDEKYNSHATIECYINEKWIIFDPTFNVVCKYNNELIGYEEMYNLCKNGLADQIKWERCGYVPENRRFENYPVPLADWHYIAFQEAQVKENDNIIFFPRQTLPETWDMSIRNGTRYFATAYNNYFHYFSMGEFRLNKKEE